MPPAPKVRPWRLYSQIWWVAYTSLGSLRVLGLLSTMPCRYTSPCARGNGTIRPLWRGSPKRSSIDKRETSFRRSAGANSWAEHGISH